MQVLNAKYFQLGIEFVIKCKEFNITGAEEQVRKLCGLVWKSDEEVRNQILEIYMYSKLSKAIILRRGNEVKHWATDVNLFRK